MKFLFALSAFALSAITPLSASDRVVSAFSSISAKHALTIADSASEKDPEIDSFTQLCPGYAGYELVHEGGDLRSWFKVRKGKTESTLNALTAVLPKGFAWEFPNISGEVVEWRGVLKGDVFRPHAIIFRVSGSDSSGREQVTKSCLVVASLAADGSAKLIGSAMGRDENDKAVAIADKSRNK